MKKYTVWRWANKEDLHTMLWCNDLFEMLQTDDLNEALECIRDYKANKVWFSEPTVYISDNSKRGMFGFTVGVPICVSFGGFTRFYDKLYIK